MRRNRWLILAAALVAMLGLGVLMTIGLSDSNPRHTNNSAGVTIGTPVPIIDPSTDTTAPDPTDTSLDRAHLLLRDFPEFYRCGHLVLVGNDPAANGYIPNAGAVAKFTFNGHKYTVEHDKGITVTGGKMATEPGEGGPYRHQDYTIKFGAGVTYFNSYAAGPSAESLMHGVLSLDVDNGPTTRVVYVIASVKHSCNTSKLLPSDFPWQDLGTSGLVEPAAALPS